jgi:hypothetical protein
MAFDIENNYSSSICFNQKRCFVILLLCNCLIAFIYYVHEQNGSKIVKARTTYTKSIHENDVLKINKAIQFIRNTLETEYNLHDLATFYNLVEKEFSLGLRCTRKKNQPQATPILTNSNLTINQQNNSNITTVRY